MSTRVDLTGQRFGKLTVIRFVGCTKARAAQYDCLCECGNHKIVRGDHLIRGAIQSCGCIVKKQQGLHDTKLYSIWRGMVKRCHNPRTQGYKNYGGRGITVCEEWRNSFLAFYQWAMSHGYQGGLAIDRIDNNSGYAPENCRWTTAKINGNNRRTNHIVEYKGEKKTISEWADILGVEYDLFYARLRIEGFSIERYIKKYCE